LSVQTFKKVKQVFAVKVWKPIPVDGDMVDLVLAKRRRNTPHVFNARTIAVTNQSWQRDPDARASGRFQRVVNHGCFSSHSFWKRGSEQWVTDR
jgi:hypothetical protein